MRSHRIFQEEEIEQLTAIGNQIGVAIENARLYQRQQEVVGQLGKMQENLRFYLQQVTKAQEEERKRISHELHDETIQALVVLSRRLDNLASDKKELPEEHRRNLEEIWQQTNDVIREIRRLSQDLRPAALDRLGLVPALEWLASEVTGYSRINTDVSVLGNVRRFSGEVELVLFRITQEALRNVWRHSGASTAKIKVELEEDKVRITISDNGKGFRIPERMVDYARDGKLGLAGMQERDQLIGGTLEVSSRQGKGTNVVIEASF
jgi:two-component system sensor histidine kinase DegS